MLIFTRTTSLSLKLVANLIHQLGETISGRRGHHAPMRIVHDRLFVDLSVPLFEVSHDNHLVVLSTTYSWEDPVMIDQMRGSKDVGPPIQSFTLGRTRSSMQYEKDAECEKRRSKKDPGRRKNTEMTGY